MRAFQTDGDTFDYVSAAYPLGDHAVWIGLGFVPSLVPERNETQAESESTYAFLCRIAGPVWDQCRELINSWIDAYPAAGRQAISARLRTGDERVFTSVFWELYLHETYRRDGWRIEVEPDVPDATTRPDFLVSKGGSTYYLEARCTFEGGHNQGAAARLQTVYDAINGIDGGAFHLAVTALRIGSQAPKTSRLLADLEAWLARLDPDADDFTLNDGHPERRYEWIHDDWQLVFQPIPRPVTARATPAQRPLGMFLPAAASYIDDIGTLRGALEEKGSKYGALPHPLVIAINIGSGFHDDLDTEQALYGTVGWRLNPNDLDAEPTPVLTKPGYWGWPGHPTHKNVAGVLLAAGVHYGWVAQYVPDFWPNPNATQPISPLSVWRIAAPTSEGIRYIEPVKTPHEHFDLPSDWPIGDPFPQH